MVNLDPVTKRSLLRDARQEEYANEVIVIAADGAVRAVLEERPKLDMARESWSAVVGK